MRSTVVILIVLVGVFGSRAQAADYYQRNVQLEGGIVLTSDDVMEVVDLVRPYASRKGERTESLSLGGSDSSFTLGERFTIEDIRRVGTSHAEGSYKLETLSTSVEVTWSNRSAKLWVSTNGRTQMELLSAALEQKLRRALDRTRRERPPEIARTATTPPAPPAPSPTRVRREFELPPLALTHNDILRLVQQIEDYLPQDKLENAKLTIGVGDKEFSVSGHLTEEAFRRLPERATSLSYTFTTYDSPITGVSLWLDDSYRRGAVEGIDGPKVNTLAGEIQSELEKHTRLIGGFGRRILLGTILFGLAWLFASLIVRDGAVTTLWKVWAIFPLVVIPLAAWLGPWDQWLPGTDIDAVEASFLNRANSWLAVIEIAIALPPVIAWVIARMKASGRNAVPNAQGAAATQPVAPPAPPATQQRAALPAARVEVTPADEDAIVEPIDYEAVTHAQEIGPVRTEGGDGQSQQDEARESGTCAT